MKNIRQLNSEKYKIAVNLPFVTDEFGDFLKHSETKDGSLAEALEKQDLFIN